MSQNSSPSELVDSIASSSLESLKLPSHFDPAVDEAVEALASYLSQPEQSDEGLHGQLALIREASYRFLDRRKGKPLFEGKSPAPPSLLIRILRGGLPFGWPFIGRRSLIYLPRNANPMDYGIPKSFFPDSQRYAYEGTVPADGSNTASRNDGKQFCFVKVDNRELRRNRSAEASIGFFYEPPNRLSEIEVSPDVNWSAKFYSLIKLTFLGGGGSIEISAQVVISLWQQTPRGLELFSFQPFDVGKSGRRDESMNGNPLGDFSRVPNQNLSAPFRVPGGRTYLILVTSRLTLFSSLFTRPGQQDVPSQEQLLVYASMSSLVSSVRVTRTKINLF